MSIFGRSKKIAWFILIAGIIVLIVLPDFREAFLRRIQYSKDRD